MCRDGSFATDAGGPTNPVMSALGQKRRDLIGEAKRHSKKSATAKFGNPGRRSVGLGKGSKKK
jgi:hypothetical protein